MTLAFAGLISGRENRRHQDLPEFKGPDRFRVTWRVIFPNGKR